MWRKIIPAVLFVLSVSTANMQAQEFQQFASFYKDARDVKAGELNVRFEGMGFFQNNEFLGQFVDGYTLPGALIRPKLTYSPADAFYIEVGGHLVKHHGKEKVENLLPWFSSRYHFNDRFAVVVGNLNQNHQHGLLEQLWEPERLYTDRPESGLQFLYSAPRLNMQTWINWEQYIEKNDPFQEHFTAGVTGNYLAYQNSVLSLSFPVQLLFYHKGGEIDSSSLRVQTHANLAGGWNLAINIDHQRLKKINLEGYWLGYKAVTEDSNVYPFSEGHAYLMSAGVQTRYSVFSINYWNAFQFIAPKGRYIYQSVSDSDPTFTKADRSVVSARYFWQKDILKDARVAFQLEGIMDVPTGDLSYSYGFFLLFNQDFLLSSIKK
ncbi:MAG TPA: hypothetical protein VFG54_07645 [Prolixibacteraceae bacterium]|nr:hypothetical protein [Prolixibacteraceae bacterium]